MQNDYLGKETIELKEALELCINAAKPKPFSEKVPLFDAVSRVLFEDISCEKELPAFTNSAMDGYAVRFSSAGRSVRVAGCIYAGSDSADITVNDGEAYKIMTGAMLPSKAEAVVMVEDAELLSDEMVKIPENLKSGANIRTKGEEVAFGETIFKEGEKLTPAHVALLASQGKSFVSVYKKPTVAIFSTGNEIKEAWERAGEHQIYNSNSVAVYSVAKSIGCDVSYIGALPDEFDATVRMIESLQGYDLIVSTGGISAGDVDFVAKAFYKCGMQEVFQKVNIKPGKPTMLGSLGSSLVLGLPGNPLSALVNFYLFGVPLLSKIGGGNRLFHNVVIVKNVEAFKIKAARANVILGTVQNGKFRVTMQNRYGSGMLTPMAKSNAFIITSQEITEVAEGAMLKAVMLGGELSSVQAEIIN